MKRTKIKFYYAVCVLLSTLFAVIMPNVTRASINITGNVTPSFDGLDPWTIAGTLRIGDTANGTIGISDGSEVYDLWGYIGYDANGIGDATVTGTDSLWQHSNSFTIGYSGVGDLLISSGGTVRTATGAGYIGYNATSTGTVDIMDANSILQITSDLYIGYSGNGEMNISNGGTATNLNGYIGYALDSVGTVTVADPNSIWMNSNDLFVGYAGEGDMTISDGASVLSSNGYLGYSTTGVGTVTVDDTNSLWENSNNLYVGYAGNAELNILNGADVTNTTGYIGYDPNSFGEVTVKWSGSLWENASDLYVGYNGDANMVVSNSAKVTNLTGYIGYGSTSTGDVEVSGTNSLWENANELYVAYSGEADLAISDGGTVTNTDGYIGYDVNSTGRVDVSEEDSLWENSGDLYVGYAGNGYLNISDTGSVTNNIGYIAYDPNSVGQVHVDDANSLWTNSAELYIGGSSSAAGGTGLLDIGTGAQVEATDVTIWSTGTLSGSGTLVTGDLINYGTIKPGDTIGTLTVDGNVTMEPNSVLYVQIDNSGNSDKLSVTGDVNIVGGIVQVSSTQTISGIWEYTIVEANSVSGTFDTLDTALLSARVLDPFADLSYDANTIILQIIARRFDDPTLAQTDNQKAISQVLQQIADNGGNSITTAIQTLSSSSQVLGAYDQLSGQTRAPLAPITVADTSKFIGTVSDRLLNTSPGLTSGHVSGPFTAMVSQTDVFDDTGAYGSNPTSDSFALGNGAKYFAKQKWGFWGRAYGVFGTRKDEEGIKGYKYSILGQSLGLDYKFTDNLLIGITGGLSNSDVDYSLSGSTSKISATHIGVYGSSYTNGLSLDSILTLSSLQYETERTISVVNEKVEGDFEGQALSGYIEARYDWLYDVSWFVQPLASAQFSYLNLDSYTETGGVSSLSFSEQTFKSFKGSIGLRARNNFYEDAAGRFATLELRGRVIHEFGDTQSNVDASFANNPGTAFKVGDSDIAKDTLVLGFGISAKPSYRTSLMFDYDLSMNSDDTAHVISAALEYRR